MTDLIGDWCEYHHNLHNISAPRRVLQLRVLRQLEASLSHPIDKVDDLDLERYMAAMIRNGYHPHTVVRDLNLIRAFLRYLWKHRYIDAERWLRLRDVRGPRGAYDGKPRPYAPHEIRQFWLDLDARYPWTRNRQPHLRTPEHGEYWVRRWVAGQSRWIRVYPYARRLQVEAICALALYGGLRRGEIYGISLEDMHYQNEYIRVTSRKGRDGIAKVRVVPMNEAISLAVGNWLEFRAQVINPPHEFPWLCLWAGSGANNVSITKPMTLTQFRMLLQEMGRGWEFHRLRHTFATERYRKGLPLEILQHILGHSDISQTQGYAQITEDRIIAASRATDKAFIEAVQIGRRTYNSNQEAS